MRRLPVFDGYTVDVRLREFRRVSLTREGDPDSRELVSIPFDSAWGQKLVAEMRRRTGKSPDEY